MVAVSSASVSHTESVPKPAVACLRSFHVCEQADSHLCTEIIFTCDSFLLYILAALNYEISWCLFIVFEYNFESSSLWQLPTPHSGWPEWIILLSSIHSWYLISKIVNVLKTLYYILYYYMMQRPKQLEEDWADKLEITFFFFWCSANCATSGTLVHLVLMLLAAGFH